MKAIILICLLTLTQFAYAIERKPLTDVDVAALTTELQAMAGGGDTLDLIWWIPLEYWEASFRQDPQIPTAQADQILAVLKDYSILAVVQADISPFGAFSFFEKPAVTNSLKVEIVNANGQGEAISHTLPSSPDVRLLLDQMRPILAQAMGNMGENFYFFPLPAYADNGQRILSPYGGEKLRVTLGRNEADSVFEIDMPVDALFTPRVCPNGKPAHVSWVYCPWSGEKLAP